MVYAPITKKWKRIKTKIIYSKPMETQKRCEIKLHGTKKQLFLFFKFKYLRKVKSQSGMFLPQFVAFFMLFRRRLNQTDRSSNNGTRAVQKLKKIAIFIKIAILTTSIRVYLHSKGSKKSPKIAKKKISNLLKQWVCFLATFQIMNISNT